LANVGNLAANGVDGFGTVRRNGHRTKIPPTDEPKPPSSSSSWHVENDHFLFRKQSLDLLLLLQP
jgi:hypothetical protein